MNTLTKTQVIALLINSTSAALTAMELLNGPSTASKLPTGQAPFPAVASSGVVCANNAACTNADEKCGAFQLAGASETTSYCVHNELCGSLGNLEGTAWSLQCWADPAEGADAVAPAAVDPAALLTALNGLMTQDTVTWSEANVLVSSKFNWMDGWFIVNGDGLFVGTDKPADNRCFFNSQCEPEEGGPEQCCGAYPDSSNRRCMAKSLDKVPQTVGPVTFTPLCAIDDAGGDVVPENAQDDIAAGALADASEALDSFWNNQVKDKQTKAGYETMDADAKAAFDKEIAAEKAKNDEVLATLKTTMGYASDTCDDNCKAKFVADINLWRKEVYEACKTNDKAIACQSANELRIQEETARAGADSADKKNFYSAMSDDERAAFEKGYADEKSKNEATITAAVIAANLPKNGETGFDCAEETSACVVGTESFWCCGTSNRVGNVAGDTTGQKTKVCARVDASGQDTRYDGAWEDALGVKYQHTCELAQKLVATAAATVAAAYALM